MKSRLDIFLVLFLYFFNQCSSQSICASKNHCGSCIQEPDCVWCKQPFDLEKKFIRCANLSAVISSWCSPEHIVSAHSRKNLIKNEPLRPLQKSGGNAVQIQPQEMEITVRRGTPIDIDFQYSQAEDYPVDLYYMMDLSASMADDKDKLSRLGDRLAEVMKKVTKNFRLGFGSFVDKVDLPFTSTVPDKLKKPCVLAGGEPCASPYSFQNHLSLTDDTEQFSKHVKNTPVSGNLDAPEGGFDGLMQAMVCQKEIGWRPNARHLLVFSTDAGFHFAGDGKLAGIIEPNDAKCHLNGTGFYTKALDFDYPSIAQINRIAKENNINIIFAIVQEQEKLYKELKSRINGASMGILSRDSSNVVDLVKGVYDELAGSVTMTDDAPRFVDIKYKSACLGTEIKETKTCDGIKFDNKINFTASITVTECPADKKDWVQVFKINPVAIEESLMVRLKIVCDCDCEQEGNFQPNSTSCSSGGNLQCGVCSCRPGYYGKKCECQSKNGLSSSDVSNKDSCRMSPTSPECSGRGSCICGVCDCYKRENNAESYSGGFCECDNFSCNRYQGELCAGNGQCVCGECQCHPDWTGSAARDCSCYNKLDRCTRSGSKDVCSGNGICKCGKCKCNDGYSGEHCEECLDCPGQKCDELKTCVECKVKNITNIDNCIEECPKFSNIRIVDKITDKEKSFDNDDDDESELDDEFKSCAIPDESNCAVKYKYIYINEIYNITIQKEKECVVPIPAPVKQVIFSLIGTIVLAGLIILIIWKLLTTMHDRKEYAKFEEERRLARWDRGENPLYKPSTTEFRNPTFKELEKRDSYKKS